MSWQSYEELVKDVYQELGKVNGVKIECWGRSCKVRGKSSVDNQIDVLTSHSDGVHEYKTAIECKYWNKKISIAHVRDISAKIADTKIVKGILVSKIGFTKGAMKLAKQNNISLVELREPRDSDWDGFIIGTDVNIYLSQDEIYDYKLSIKRNGNVPVMSSNECLVDVGQQNYMSLQQIADKIRKLPVSEENAVGSNGFCWTVTTVNERVRAYVVTFPDETLVTHSTAGSIGHIQKLEFKIREKLIEHKIHIDFRECVAWVMEAIFEGKKFGISPTRVPKPW